jgi:hypothetical protein
MPSRIIAPSYPLASAFSAIFNSRSAVRSVL